MKSTACAAVMLLSLGSAAAGCKASNKPATLKIVSSLVRTGSANPQTTNVTRGIRLAIDDVGGKVVAPSGTFTVAYEDWDDASAKKGDWDPEVEASNAERAVADADVMAYIGPYSSGAAKISLPILNRAALIAVSPACTYPGLTKPGLGEVNEPQVYRPSGAINFFRVVPADDIQGRVAASWMHDMGARSVYVLDDLQLYGKGLADVFADSAEDLGVRVLGHESIDPKAQEYRSLMAKIKQRNPDWVYFGGTTQSNAGQLIKDLVAEGVRARVMVPDGCFEDALITAAGAEHANGRVFATFGGVPPGRLAGAGKRFVEHFTGRYGQAPDAYAVYGYAAAQAVLEAFRLAGVKDREVIRQKMMQVHVVDSALGDWAFDANGDTTMEIMSGNAVDQGAFHFVTLLGRRSP